MRWLKRIALTLTGLIALAALGLFAAAHRADAGHNHASVVIDRPAVAVFRYFTDYAQVKRWVPMLQGIKYVRGDGFAVGSVARLSMQGAEEDEEIVAIEPGRRLGLRLSGTGGEFDEVCDYLFDEAGGKTTVRVEAHTRYHGAFLLLEPIITPSADDALAGALGKLKVLAEREVPATAP
jgi:uncharacterized protein YndB with AHSA1/START domain